MPSLQDTSEIQSLQQYYLIDQHSIISKKKIGRRGYDQKEVCPSPQKKETNVQHTI